MENEEPMKKDTTKEKIILFIIGVLTGAVISTGAFFAYIKLAGVGTNSGNQSMQMPGGTPPEMPSNNQGGTPPEMPNGDQEGTPPEMPSGENNSDNTESQDNQNNQGGTSRSKSKNNKTQNTNS